MNKINKRERKERKERKGKKGKWKDIREEWRNVGKKGWKEEEREKLSGDKYATPLPH